MKLTWLLLCLVVGVLLVPAVAMTVGRLVGPWSGRWVLLVSFAPYAVVLYALALLLLLVALLAAHGGGRTLAAALAVVAVLGLGLHVFWASGAYVGPAPVAAGNGKPFTVMTANLMLGHGSPAQVVDVAVRNDVDVLALEEVSPQLLSGMRAAGLDAAYPHSAGAPTAGASGTMVFSVYPLTHAERLDTPLGSWRVSVRRPAGSFELLAVHPRPPTDGSPGWAADHRVVQQAAVAPHGPVVLLGDFNATLDHAPMRDLLGSGFHDAAVQARSGWQPTWPSDGQVSVLGVPVPSLVTIDHVLLKGSERALRTETVQISGSDHRALLVRMVW